MRAADPTDVEHSMAAETERVWEMSLRRKSGPGRAVQGRAKLHSEGQSGICEYVQAAIAKLCIS